jgi:transcriptional regulator with XRE-family HTH domain
MTEATYRLRIDLVKKLRKACGKSWSTIAKECDGIHLGTIKRWLNGGRVRMDNIGRLAKALGTTADKILLPDDEEDLTDYVDGEIDIEGSLLDLKQPQDITVILEKVQKAIGSKYRIMFMYVGDGSIKIGIKLHMSDAIKLLKASHTGKLDFLDVKLIKLYMCSHTISARQIHESLSVSEKQASVPITETYMDKIRASIPPLDALANIVCTVGIATIAVFQAADTNLPSSVTLAVLAVAAGIHAALVLASTSSLKKKEGTLSYPYLDKVMERDNKIT